MKIRVVPAGVEFAVRVAPRASRTTLMGVHDGALKIALTAPPVDGKANATLIKWLAKKLGVAGQKLTLIRGARAKDKWLLAEVDEAAVRALFVEAAG